MTDNDTIQMMQSCANEIRRLRRQVEQLSPLAQAYNDISSLLALLPQKSQGMGEDIAWRLDREIAKLADEIKTKDAPK